MITIVKKKNYAIYTIRQQSTYNTSKTVIDGIVERQVDDTRYT